MSEIVPESEITKYGEGFVYFVQVVGDGPIKIGKANDPERRVNSLVTGIPYDITTLLLVPGGSLEKDFHAYFFSCWMKGEWFRADNFLLTHIHIMKGATLATTRIRGEDVPVVKPPDLGKVSAKHLRLMRSSRVGLKIAEPTKLKLHAYGPGKFTSKSGNAVF
jgi:hypothetical protein